IFVTALEDSQDEEIGLSLGAVDYLHKPCPAPILLRRVRIHMDLHNQSRALEAKVLERTNQLDSTRLQIVRRLTRAAEYRDNETGMHVIRMSESTGLLARAVGVSSPNVQMLIEAATMHDIGKIGIPDSILLKPAKLNDQEWEAMKTHTLIGAEIIGEHSSDLLQLARSVALNHHERWDGTGYPNGLRGANIPIEGRMVAIADVYDALTSERPYKKAWPVEQARAYLVEQAGLAFDPDLVGVFESLIPEINEIGRRFADQV
ncbi:MAG: HD-GYP domain-containing protein, partial [Rhodoferax sp.]